MSGFWRHLSGRLAVILIAAGLCAVLVIAGSLPWWAVLLAAIAGGGVALAMAQVPSSSVGIATAAVSKPEAINTFVDELMEFVEHPLLVIDGKRRVEAANGSARKLLGEHIIGQDVRLAIRNPAAAALLTSGSTPGTCVELLDLGGVDQRWEMLADPLGERQIIRLVDRTALRAAEQMRVDFVANASHELRTPLATLIGFIETLEGPAADDEATRTRFLRIMHGEAQRMIRLVDDLMSLSRIEADKHRAPTTPVALVQLVEEVRLALGPRLAEGGRELIIDADPDAASVAGDRDQLLQLLHNLVGNALKYGRKGTPITVRIRRDGLAMIRLVVEDEGEGIAPEHLSRLTERFYRVDASRSRSIGGTGLGLSIVKHIVERHRGQLLIESEIGRGSRITALLPTAPIHTDQTGVS